MSGTVQDLGEAGLIGLFAVDGGAIGSRLLVPNGDDAAAWFTDPKYASVITTDTLVEDVHFRLDRGSPRKLGRKLMAVSLSDIAAMGARARYALLSVSLPSGMSILVIKKIASGIREVCKAHGVAVIGGNVTRSPGPVMLSSTVIGRASPDELIRRRGALLGDAIFVTGRLGSARAGLELLESGNAQSPDDPFHTLVDSLLDPNPRIDAGRALARTRVVHAMLDVSDGLGQDLPRLLAPEGLGARIDASCLPVQPELRMYAEQRGRSHTVYALQGGEDYELLFVADPGDEKVIVETLTSVATPVARIGTTVAEPAIEVIMPDGTVGPMPRGFSHF